MNKMNTLKNTWTYVKSLKFVIMLNMLVEMCVVDPFKLMCNNMSNLQNPTNVVLLFLLCVYEPLKLMCTNFVVIAYLTYDIMSFKRNKKQTC